MKKIIFFAAILFISLSACQKGDVMIKDEALKLANQDAISDVETRGNNPKARPFKGTLFFDRSGDYEDCLTCPYAADSPFGSFRKFVGQGDLTHFGNTTAESMSCFFYIFDEDFTILGFTLEEQCNTFIAANGDVLYSYQDEYDAVWNPECSCYYGVTTGYFDGSTGRFEGAEGVTTAQVSQDASSTTWG